MKPDKRIYKAVADSLALATPAFVEKDYYAVQTLKAIQHLNIEGYTIVFAGGTCLSKAHRKIMRFSEDIDVKLIASEDFKQLPKNQQINSRKKVTNAIIEIINDSDTISLISPPSKRNEGKFQNFQIKYPSFYEIPEYIRPYIQLELIESSLNDEVEQHDISSLISEESGNQSEIKNMNCVSINSIAAEKLLSLLRRTALVARNNEKRDDPRLIRHAYDLTLISSLIDTVKASNLLSKVIPTEVKEFGAKHKQFSVAPKDELFYGLQCIMKEKIHEDRYKEFTGPLVYNSFPPEWNEIKSTLEGLFTKII